MASFLGRHIAVCSHSLRCGGDPFACLRGVLSPRGPPFFRLSGGLVRCGLIVGCALPAVLCPWSCVLLSLVRGPSLAVFALCQCFCLCGFGRFSVVVVLLFVGGWASVFLSSVWLLSAPPPADRCFPSPCGWSLVASWSSLSLVPPSGYLVAFVTAWLPCLRAGSVVVLCRPHFILSHGSKGLWPCVGFVFPLHHDACVVRVLSITTLRYSSMMIQVPHWTPLSFTFAILKL